MPLYEYKCEKCGQCVDIIQRVSDKPYSHCPKCGGDMKKQVSAPAIQFKGSGFYKTDYASSKSSDSGSSEKTESKSEKQTDKKTDKQTDKKSD